MWIKQQWYFQTVPVTKHKTNSILSASCTATCGSSSIEISRLFLHIKLQIVNSPLFISINTELSINVDLVKRTCVQWIVYRCFVALRQLHQIRLSTATFKSLVVALIHADSNVSIIGGRWSFWSTPTADSQVFIIGGRSNPRRQPSFLSLVVVRIPPKPNYGNSARVGLPTYLVVVFNCCRLQLHDSL